jgi:hypothetical protein
MYARASRNVRKNDATFAGRSTGLQPPWSIIKAGLSAMSAFSPLCDAYSARFNLISYREPLFDRISAAVAVIKVGFSYYLGTKR